MKCGVRWTLYSLEELESHGCSANICLYIYKYRHTVYVENQCLCEEALPTLMEIQTGFLEVVYIIPGRHRCGHHRIGLIKKI